MKSGDGAFLETSPPVCVLSPLSTGCFSKGRVPYLDTWQVGKGLGPAHLSQGFNTALNPRPYLTILSLGLPIRTRWKAFLECECLENSDSAGWGLIPERISLGIPMCSLVRFPDIFAVYVLGPAQSRQLRYRLCYLSSFSVTPSTSTEPAYISL